MDRRTFTQSVAAGCLAAAAGSLAAQDEKPKQEWGDLTVTFLYDGEPPLPKLIAIEGRPPAAVKLPLLDQSLVVDRETSGIANVIVWLRTDPKAAPPAIHPDQEALAKEPVKLKFQDFQFEPRMTLIRTKQPLEIENADPVTHIFKAALFKDPIALPVPEGGAAKATFLRPETRPMPLSGAPFAWLDGYIFVRSDPYMAVSDSQGKLTIKQLPVGVHTFVLWHELCGWLINIQHDGKSEALAQGRLTVEIKPGENDLGKIICKPDWRR
jgi:hypothetical protein